MIPTVAAVTLVEMAAVGALGLASWSDAKAAVWLARPALLTEMMIAALFVALGLVIVTRRPGNVIGWLLASIGTTFLAYQAAGEYAVRGLVLAPGSLPGAGIAALASQVVWAVWVLPTGLLLLLYPTGRLPSGRWIPVTWAVIAGTVLIVGPGMAALWAVRDAGAALLFDLDAVAPTWPPSVLIGLVLLVVGFAGAVVSLVVRWHRSDDVERLQLKWLIPSGLLLLGHAVFNSVTVEGGGWLEVLFLLAFGTVPVAVTVAILRYRLYEIDRIISRTVTYGVVSGVLLGVYMVVAVVPAAVFELESDLLVAGATLVAAAAFGPVRRRVQGLVDRRFNRSRYDAAQVVDRFAGRLRDEVDLASLTGDLQAVVAMTVQPGHVSLWLRE